MRLQDKLHNKMVDIRYNIATWLFYRPCGACRAFCACPACGDTGRRPRRWALRIGLAEDRRWDKL